MYVCCVITLLIACVVVEVELAKILGVFPTSAVDHFELGNAMMKELVKKGHQVTVVSPFKVETDQNYTNIVLTKNTNIREELFGEGDFPKNLRRQEYGCPVTAITYIHRKSLELTESLLADPNLQILLQSGEKFDVIVLEYLMNEAALGMGKVFDAPIVLFSPYPSSTLNNHLFSNPAPSSFVPNLLTGYTGAMDFWQRANNVAFNNFNNFYRQYSVLPKQEMLLKTYIDRDLQLEDVMKTVSLMLLNSHPSISEPVPHTPNMIEVGGFHFTQKQELPTALKRKMDEAEEGVIFVAMTTDFNAYEFHTATQMLAASLEGTGLEFVYESVNLNNEGGNDRLFMEFPRHAVLAHPNVKLAISSGGLLNIIEAAYCGIPVLAIASHEDQSLQMAIKNGYAVSLPYKELSRGKLNGEKLNATLVGILSNSTYRINARFRSEILKDQPIKPMDSVVYWIEYAIKHKGAKHLQSPGIFLKWYQRNLIDLILVLTVLVIVFFLIFYYIFKYIIHVVRKIKDRKAKQYNKLIE